MPRTWFLISLLLASLAAPASANEAPATHDAPAEAAARPEGEGHAKEDKGHGSEGEGADAAKAEQAAPVEEGDAFCEGIIDPARERRYFLKQQELKALLVSVDERLASLEKKKAEYEEWVKRREDFAQMATKNLVEIYSNMKPEASAARISALQTDLAASLLLAISPRQASAILNEMDEKTAAELTGIMAASARAKDPS